MEYLVMPLQAASLLSPLYTAFGWLMAQFYSVFNNYGIVIILFTVLLRGVMIPLNIRQQKNSLKQQALSRDMNELSRIYGDDRMGLQEAQAALFKKHGISTTSGCLMSLLPMFLIWPVYRIISAPMKYIMRVAEGNITAIATMLNGKGLFPENLISAAADNNIPVMNALHSNPSMYAAAVNNGWIKVGDVLDIDFFGINLGLTPQWRPASLFGAEASTYLPLLAIALLAVATTFLVSKVQEWTNPMYWKIREEKRLAKNNPARTVSDDAMSSGMMKSMKWMMPIFTLFMIFSMPAAMGLYWIVGNIMSAFQAALFYYIYAKPAFANTGSDSPMNRSDSKRLNKGKRKKGTA